MYGWTVGAPSQHTSLGKSFLAWCLWAVCGVHCVSGTANAKEVSWLEDFAISEQRQAALQSLLPGTEEYFYYHCLWLQHEGRFAEAESQLSAWIQQHGRSPQTKEIESRQYLLTFDQNPDATWDYLKRELGYGFDHRRERVDQAPDLPERLDGQSIRRDVLTDRALRSKRGLAPFSDSALDWIDAGRLDDKLRRELLSRLTRPDRDDLVSLVASDLRARGSRGFGSLEIHTKLLLPQLDALGTQMPDVAQSEPYVSAYLQKLHPGIDLEFDPAARRAYLDRLATFVDGLNHVHNSLKAHVLFHQLNDDLGRGEYNLQRFKNYLALPRRVGYAPRRRTRRANDRAWVDFNLSPPTYLPPVGSDASLVHTYLDHFLASARDYREFSDLVNETYLKAVFAEAKLTRGLGNPERWYPLLSPAKLEALRDRVDLDFAATNPERFGREQPVRLQVDTKNVTSLIVKIYEINALNYLRRKQRPIGIDLDLDGLVPNGEQTFTYQESPLRRIRRTFTFPELDRPGIYVIDFIGNGRSSRVLLRKGDLQVVVQPTQDGQRVRVFDERRRPVPNATVWLKGHRFVATEDGTVFVPFSHVGKSTSMIVQQGELAVLRTFAHAEESYQFDAAMFVERESLRTNELAEIAVRARLRQNHSPISVASLRDVQLTITATDQMDVKSTQVISDLQLRDEKETVTSFRVPAYLKALQLTLTANVEQTTTDDLAPVTATQSYTINHIDESDQIATLYLHRDEAEYLLTLRGKSGELLPQRPINLALRHRDFVDPISVTLKTDAQGTVALGQLADITTVTGQIPGGPPRKWPLVEAQRTYPSVVHAAAHTEIRLPLAFGAARLGRSVACRTATGQFRAENS